METHTTHSAKEHCLHRRVNHATTRTKKQTNMGIDKGCTAISKKSGLLEHSAALDELFHSRLQELHVDPRTTRRALLELHHSPLRGVLLPLGDLLGGVVRLIPARGHKTNTCVACSRSNSTQQRTTPVRGADTAPNHSLCQRRDTGGLSPHELRRPRKVRAQVGAGRPPKKRGERARS